VISFRYLVVTIVSIFLALGLGILAGTTIIDQSLVKNLRENTASAERARDKALHRSTDLTSVLGLLVPRVIDGRLAHRQIVLVTDDNTDGGAVGQVRTVLTQARADLVAELHVTGSLAPSSTAKAALAQLLINDGEPAPGNLSRAAALDLANRLATGPPAADVRTGRQTQHDLLADLLSGGFLDFPHTNPPKPQAVGGAGQVVVVVAGGGSDPAVPFDDFMLPFVEQLIGRQVAVAVAEPQVTAQSFVGMVRHDGAVASSGDLVTVDDLSTDDPAGGVALVLGLREMLRSPGVGGNYGVKTGATGLIPATSAQP